MAINFMNVAVADEGDSHGDRDHRRPVYQRHAFDWKDHGRRDDKFRRHSFFVPPQVNAAWFQRPYPYHLDYYKMRYGGSYAPYFGNLYGPPQVVTAPPYYGPYYGDFGYGANGNPGAYEEIPPQAPGGPNVAPGGWGNVPGMNSGAMPQAPAP